MHSRARVVAVAAAMLSVVGLVGGCSTQTYGVSHNSTIGYAQALTGVAIDDRFEANQVSVGIGLRHVQTSGGTARVNFDDLVFDYE